MSKRRRALLGLILALAVAGFVVALVLLLGEDEAESFKKDFGGVNSQIQDQEDGILDGLKDADDGRKAGRFDEFARRNRDLEQKVDDLEPPSDFEGEISELRVLIQRQTTEIDVYTQALRASDRAAIAAAQARLERTAREIKALADRIARKSGVPPRAGPSRPPSPGGPSGARVQRAKVGQSLVLDGEDDGKKHRVRVTIEKVVPLKGNPSQPLASGERVAGVFFRLENLGRTSYEFFPRNDMEITECDGTGCSGEIYHADKDCQRLESTLPPDLRPGTSARYCLSYKVLAGLKLKTVEYELEGGVDEKDRRGIWSVSGAP